MALSSRQTIRFCVAPDGTRIAIASIGSGPPLMRAAHWLSLSTSCSTWLSQCAARISGGPEPIEAMAMRVPSGATQKRMV